MRFRRSTVLLGVASVGLLLSLVQPKSIQAAGWPGASVQVQEGLRSDDLEHRRVAASRLSRLSYAEARRLELLGFSDPDELVRLEAARAAVVHGHRGLGDKVQEWLTEKDARLRISALRVLGLDLDRTGLTVVAEALSDPDASVRSAAARALRRAREEDAELATGALLPALDDTEPEVRREAVDAVGRLGQGAAASVALRLSDADEDVRHAAAVALGVVGDETAVPALLLALSDSEAIVADAAARSLGRLGGRSALAALVSVARTKAEPARRGALEGLARLALEAGDELVVDRALEVIADEASSGENAQVQRALEIPAATPILRRLARQAAGAQLTVLVVRLLRQGAWGDAELNRSLLGGRLAERDLLAAAAGVESEPLLVLALERLTGQDAELRVRALNYLETVAPLDEAAAEPLVDALHAPGFTPNERARVLNLLAALDGAQLVSGKMRKRLLGESQSYAASTVPQVRAAALGLQARVGSPTEALSLLDSPDALVRHRAATALASGMSSAFAQGLLQGLVRVGGQGKPTTLEALSGVPQDMGPSAIASLVTLVREARGAPRGALLDILGRVGGAEPALLQLATEGSVVVRRKLAGIAAARGDFGTLARRLLDDADERVRMAAVSGASHSGHVARLIEMAKNDEHQGVRTAAAFQLSRLAAKQAVAEIDVCEGVSSRQLGRRAAAVALGARGGAECVVSQLQELLLHEREPFVRRVAATVLRERGEGKRALGVCAVYEVDPEVATACVEEGEPSRAASDSDAPGNYQSVEFFQPWAVLPVPGSPYALVTPAGEVIFGVTDGRGRALIGAALDVGRLQIVDTQAVL